MFARFAIWAWVSVAAALPAQAAGLLVDVTDADGHALAGTVVIANPLEKNSAPRGAATTAVMDQLNKAFVPQVLIVRVGTPVVFPNGDAVAHQVYSFSPAKRFQLPLYRGQPHEPVVFDHPGLVVLGCNIHDSMVGYIYVTESPYFSQTDSAGRATLSVPAGRYTLTAWSARLSIQPAPQDVTMAEGDVTLHVQTTERARAHDDAPAPKRLRDY